MRKVVSLIFMLFFFILFGCKENETYKVRFVGFNETLILEDSYQKNEIIKYPSYEIVEGYEFIGWDQNIDKVTDNLTIKAIYEKKTFTIDFKTQFGDLIEAYELQYNEKILYPIAPSIEGYDFVKWDKEITNANSDITITAIYQETLYEVIFQTQFGNLIDIKNMNSNDKLIYPKAPTIEGYHFVEWDQNMDYVNNNLIIHAIYEKNVYTITFKTQFDDIIEIKEYRYLECIIYPEPLKIEGYQFVSWDSNEEYVSNNLEIIAYYNIKQLMVTFIGLEGNIIASLTVNYMKPFTYPNPPVIEGYHFVGWDQNLIAVKENTTVVAIYKKNEIEVKVLNQVISNYQNVILLNGAIDNSSNEKIAEFFIEINDERTSFALDTDNSFSLSISTDFQSSSKVIINYFIRLEDGRIVKIFSDEYLIYIQLDTPDYTSYIDYINLDDSVSIHHIIESFDYEESFIITLENIIYGGYRGTNELHVYDASNYRKCNSYGHEIAIDSNGFVIDSKTLVDLPIDGLILSGHGTSANLLQKNLKIGDYVIYNQEKKSINVYRNTIVSNLISLKESICLAKVKIETAYKKQKALDYQNLERIYNQVLNDFEIITLNYNELLVEKIRNHLAKLHFGVIENKFLEVKAFWHYPMRAKGYSENSKDEVCRFLDQVYKMGFNTIYVNTNFNGGSVYPSRYVKQIKANNFFYDGYKDYLECFISEAHIRDIRVIAWSNTFVCGDGYLPSYTPKQYVALDYHGNNNSGNIYFYDITNPEVQELLVNVYSELVTNYDLDGIEYDFVRYPASNLYTFIGEITDSSKINDFGYTESSINLFKERYKIGDDVKNLMLINDEIRKKWQAFKVSNVTNMVGMISNAIKDINCNIMISAAVMSSLSGAIQTYSQDFETWIKEGYVNNLDPMIYSGSNSYVLSKIDSFIETIHHGANIVIGISPDNSGGNGITISEQIDIISNYLQLGFNAFSCKNIFSSEEVMNGLEMLQRNYNTTIYDDASNIRKKYALSMIDRIDNYYKYLDIMSNSEKLIKLYNLLYSDLVDINQIIEELNKISDITIRNKLILELEYVKLIMEDKL